MSDNPHLIEKNIHGTFDTGLLVTGFSGIIGALNANFPVSKSQNNHMLSKCVKELNKKLDAFGLTSFIVGEKDAGFLPSNIRDEFLGAAPTIGTIDFLELENDDFLLQENDSKLVIIPDN